MHICYVESGYPVASGGGGGAGTYVQLIGRELVQRGHKVSVVAAWFPDCPLVYDDQGVTVYRSNVKGSLHWYLGKLPGIRISSLSIRYLESGWRLYRFIEGLHRKTPIDLVEFTEGGDFWHALFPSFPYITHLHGSRYTFLKMSGRPVKRADWYHRKLELFFIRKAQWVVSPSHALLHIVRQEAGRQFERATVLPYPLDQRLLVAKNGAKKSNNQQRIVLFAARNDPVKGADILLKAVPFVREKAPNVEFRFFGFEPSQKMNMPEGVRCFPFIPKEKLLEQYHQADICVVPSRWDNSPNTVYEAMAAGKAVVGSRVGGIPELVVDGETGYIVSQGDPQQLATSITVLLMDDKKRVEMGQCGRERIQQLTGLQANLDQRLEIYQRVV